MQSSSTEDPKGAAKPAERISLKAILRFALILLLLPLLLFGAAGSLNWPMGWTYVGIYFISVFISRIIVMIKFPELLSERAQFVQAEGAKDWDRVLAPLIALLGPLITLIVIGLDKRFGWSPPISFPVQLIGLGLVVLGLAIGTWAMAINKFFSSVVRIQKDRGHTVATGGPYRFVRHPGYAGGILSMLAAPIMLSSLWSLIPTALVLVGYFIRTFLEDKELIKELDGYDQYAQKTRYRLIPGIW